MKHLAGFLAGSALALALAGCVTPETGDFALCCTCLAQKSPVNGGDAVDPSTNCLPDDDAAGDPSEADGCNAEAADAIADPGGDHPILVTDENCAVTTCQEECNGAVLRGAKFKLQEQSLSQ